MFAIRPFFDIFRFLILCIPPIQVSCFNIDVRHPVIHRSTTNSMFGYSIDFYQHQGMALLVVDFFFFKKK